MRKIWDLLAIFVSLLYSIIIWLDFLGITPYTISAVITTAIVWLVGIIIISLGAKFIGWMLEFFDTVLEAEVNKIKASK